MLGAESSLVFLFSVWDQIYGMAYRRNKKEFPISRTVRNKLCMYFRACWPENTYKLALGLGLHLCPFCNLCALCLLEKDGLESSCIPDAVMLASQAQSCYSIVSLQR
jgi:hypothetical protein